MGPLKKALDAIKPKAAFAVMSEPSPGPGEDPDTAQHHSGDLARRMFEDSGLAMVLGKLSGKIVEANPAFCRILGYTEAELKKLTVFDLTHADDLPGMKERRKAHIEDNVESFPLEKRYLHKDGHAVWVRGTSSLIRDADGHPAYVLGQLQDITETKKIEEEANTERENFRLAMESIADGVVLFDNDGKFVFCNNAYRKNLEPIQDLLVPGTPFETIVRAIAEKGLITIPKGDLEGYVRRRITRRQKNRKEPFTLHFTATDRWVVVNEYRTADGGTFVVRTDITEQKKTEDSLLESQSNFLAAIDNMAEGFALFDAEDRLVQCNQIYLEAFGPEVVETFVHGVTFEELIRTAAKYGYFTVDGQSTEQAIRERLEQHRDPQGPIEAQRGNGRWFLVNESKIPGGGTVLLRQEITERKRAEEQLRTTIESLPEGFLYFDADDRLVLVNSKIAEIYPLAADVFVPGVSYETCMRMGVERGQWGPDDGQDKDEWIQERLDYHYDPKGSVEYNLPGGRVIRVEEKRTPDGGIVGVRTDITELKKIEQELRNAHDELEHRVEERTAKLHESEARFRIVVDSSPAGITLKGSDGVFLMVNKTFAKWVNADPSEIEGKTVYDMLPREQADEVESLDRKIFETGEESVNEGTRTFRDGVPRAVITHKCPVHDSAGEIVAVSTIITDFTERMKAEEALRVSERNYRALFENAAVGIGRTRIKDGKVLLANSKLARIFGYERVEQFITEFSFADHHTNPGERERLIALYKKSPDNTVEVSFTTRDGSTVIVANQGWVDEKAGHIDFVMTDITERKQFEKALLESEEKLREILEKSPIGVAIVTHSDDDARLAGNRLYVNPAFVHMFGGSSADEMLGSRIFDSWVDHDQLQAVEKMMKARDDLVDFEALRRREDGTEWWVSMNSRPIRFEDQDCSMIWHSDITERKRADEALRERTVALSEKVKEHRRAEEAFRTSEQRLRSIMENIVEAVITISEDGAMETFNPAAEEMFGYEPDEVLGENVSMLADEPDRSGHDQYLRNYLHTGEAKIIGIGFREIRARRKDGSVFTAELAINEIGRGRRRQFVGTLRDVTERKQADEALRAAKERAEFANRAKTEFLAHMSHELRTPLNAILGYSDILKAEMFGPLGDEKYPEYVENIRDAGIHLLTIISDILDVSKVEAGELDIEDGEVDLGRIVQDCRSMVQEKADLAKVRLTVKTARNLPRLRADGRRLKQILLNLLTNAIKFTPEKGKVTVHAATDKAGALVLRVTDTGIGIAAEDIPRVLQPFGQVTDAYVSTPQEGSGLGLSLVKALTELHGGTLDLDSTPGKGTRVTVTFPPERSLAD